MLKRIVLLLLEFSAALAGNLIAGWIQQDVWTNLFTPQRLVGAFAAALIFLIVIAWLESARALPWNWWWHRYWYLRALRNDPTLRRWETDFARLEVARAKRSVSTIEVVSKENPDREELEKVLYDIIRGRRGATRRVLVLGEPGSGKTTALERTAVQLAQQATQGLRFGFGVPMPVLVRLGRYTSGNLIDYVGDTIWLTIGGRTGKALKQNVEYLLEHGKIVLLFDALDEALGSQGTSLISEIERCLGKPYLSTPIVITSRILDAPLGRFGSLPTFEIQPLSDEAVRTFIRAYKKTSDIETDIWTRLDEAGLLESRGLGRNPFWLKLIIQSGVFQGNKGVILQNAIRDLLYREWEGKQETRRGWQRVLPKEVQLDFTRRGLAQLAYDFSIQGVVSREALPTVRALEDWLVSQPGRGTLSAWDILALGRDAQILMYDPDPVQFRHRLLQEFLTAWKLVQEPTSLSDALLQEWSQQTKWWQTAHLYCALLSPGDAVQFIERLLSFVGEPKSNAVWLALACWPSVPGAEEESLKLRLCNAVQNKLCDLESLSSDEIDSINRAIQIAGKAGWDILKQAHRGADTRTRSYLYAIIAQTDDPFALDWVAHYGLADSDELAAQVAIDILLQAKDKAIWPCIRGIYRENESASTRSALILQELGSPTAIPHLLRTDKTDQVYIQALATCSVKFPSRLLQAVYSPNAHEREKAVQALGQLGQATPAVLDALVRTLGDKNSDVRSKAATVLGQLGQATPAVLDALVRALGDKNSDVRYHATEAFVKLGQATPAVLDALVRALGDKDSDVRSKAAKALRELGANLPEILVSKLKQELGKGFENVPALLSEWGDIFEQSRDTLSTNPQALAAWVKTLGLVGSERSVRPLIEILEKTDDVTVRGNVAEALVQIGESVLPSVQPLLRSRSTDIRRTVAVVLWNIRTPKTLQSLSECANDSDIVVQRLARKAQAWLEGGVVAKSPSSSESAGQRMPVSEHARELESRLGLYLVSTLVLTGIFFILIDPLVWIVNSLYATALQADTLSLWERGALAFDAAFYMGLFLLVYQVWKFAEPALLPSEKSQASILLLARVFLWICLIPLAVYLVAHALDWGESNLPYIVWLFGAQVRVPNTNGVVKGALFALTYATISRWILSIGIETLVRKSRQSTGFFVDLDRMKRSQKNLALVLGILFVLLPLTVEMLIAFGVIAVLFGVAVVLSHPEWFKSVAASIRSFSGELRESVSKIGISTTPVEPETLSQDSSQTPQSHLQELRWRALICLGTLSLSTVVFFYFADWLVSIVNVVYAAALGTASLSLWERAVLAFDAAFFVTVPLLIYQALMYIRPALYPREYLVARKFVFFSLGFWLVLLPFAILAIARALHQGASHFPSAEWLFGVQTRVAVTNQLVKSLLLLVGIGILYSFLRRALQNSGCLLGFILLLLPISLIVIFLPMLFIVGSVFFILQVALIGFLTVILSPRLRARLISWLKDAQQDSE